MFEERPKAGSSSVASATQKQRTYPRYQFTGAAEALDQHRRTRMNARVSDLGKGGCYVDTFSPFPLKTEVKMRITRDKISFEADARVLYSKIGMGMGLEFTAIDPQQIGILDKWLGELSGTAPLDLSSPDDRNVSPGNGSHVGPPKEPGYVLNELIVSLMRKGMLTEEEGKTMLLRLIHHDFMP
jgi:hypothetical protein